MKTIIDAYEEYRLKNRVSSTCNLNVNDAENFSGNKHFERQRTFILPPNNHIEKWHNDKSLCKPDCIETAIIHQKLS